MINEQELTDLCACGSRRFSKIGENPSLVILAEFLRDEEVINFEDNLIRLVRPQKLLYQNMYYYDTEKTGITREFYRDAAEKYNVQNKVVKKVLPRLVSLQEKYSFELIDLDITDSEFEEARNNYNSKNPGYDFHTYSEQCCLVRAKRMAEKILEFNKINGDNNIVSGDNNKCSGVGINSIIINNSENLMAVIADDYLDKKYDFYKLLKESKVPFYLVLKE